MMNLDPSSAGTPVIRLATAADAEQVQAVYAPSCARESHVSFEFVAPTVEEMGRRIERTLERYPWLVCEYGGEVLGYVYACTHSERAAYDWSVNTAVYIGPDGRRSGVGRGLYTSLFAALRLQGMVNAYAGTSLPNDASVGLHKAMGFEPVGVYNGVGYKSGVWHDVAWWQFALQPRSADPAPPVSLAAVRDTPAWREAIASGLPMLRLGPAETGSRGG